MTKENWGLRKCNKPRCPACKHVIPGGYVQANIPQKTVKTRAEVTCESTYVVYCISCKKCPSQYVGETKRKVKTRFSEHLRYAKQGDKKCATGEHFSQSDHSYEDMQLQILEQIKSEDKSHLQTREDYWIGFMRTRTKPGLNTNL